MSLFSDLSKESFIKKYWQQQSLLVRQSLPNIIDIIDGNDLAGLACEDMVESRIISGAGLKAHWSCQHGPFSEEAFSNLPDKNWTLLVQSVDQWFEEVRSILDIFDFLPRWRLEDIMISYAPTGGGVGPHFDYYDVFLIQVSGSRQWKLGQKCDENTLLQENREIKLLSEFVEDENHEVTPGDMLYIPSGIAHWGTAMTDDCITLSVGFRAPSEKELLITALDHIANNASEKKRYQDTPESIDNNPDKINSDVLKQLNNFTNKFTPEMLQEAIHKAFGELVTEPKNCTDNNALQSYTTPILKTIFSEQKKLIFLTPPHTRLAFSSSYLFINGDTYRTEEDFAKSICQGSLDKLPNSQQFELLVDLINQGELILQH